MGTKDMDDPMDLGPFFQSYVLQNPFSTLMVPKTENKDTIKCNVPKLNCNVPKTKVLAVTPSTTSHDTKCDILVLPPASENGKMKPTMNDISSLVTDTPKAHIGSNFHFAMMLRHFKVSDIHRDIQKWLWDEYRYVKEYPGQVPQSELLATAQKHFPELSSSVLSRVMKFTFPKCPKTLNKLGTFYTGLVRRPQLEDYHNIDALRAADHIHSTSCSIDVAASVYLVSEATVASIMYWRNSPATSLPNPMSLPSMVSGHGRQSATVSDSEQGLHAEVVETCDDNSTDSVTCHQNADASDSDVSQSPPRITPRKQPYVHQMFHNRRSMNGVGVVANGGSHAEVCVEEWTGGSGAADSTDSRGSTASNQSQTRSKRRRNSTDCADVLDKRIKPENGMTEWCVRSTAATATSDEEQQHVAVKEEHVDPEYSDDVTASSGSHSCVTPPSERMTIDSRFARYACQTVSGCRNDICSDRVSVSTSNVHSPNGHAAKSDSTVPTPGGSRVDRTSMCGVVSSCTDADTDVISSTMTTRSKTAHQHTDDNIFNSALLQSIKSNHTLRRRLDDMQHHLAEQQKDGTRLTQELAAAQRRVQLLEHSLDARNTQLTQLAEEFFAFGDKFQQLSRHFQLALIGVTEPGDKGK